MSRRQVNVLLVAAAVLAALSGTQFARSEVAALQNGVAPSAEYAGCKDTCISNDQWSRARDAGRSESLSSSRGGRILIQFDLAPIPKDDPIYKAVLRLADTDYPLRGKDGKFWTGLEAYPMTREWKDSANWLEHTKTNFKEKDAGDWEHEGGDYNAEKNYVASDTVADGAWGHAHDLDVTELVKLWHTGKLANNGMILLVDAKNPGGCSVASSEWPMPAFRPQLIVDHGKAAAGIAALTPAPKDIELDPVAKASDAGTAKGDYAAVRVGQNPNCALRGSSTDAYVKENARTYPGNWGWVNFGRVGGVAGDVSRTLLSFDLKDIPKDASIKEAKLVCTISPPTSRQVRSYRYGVFLLKQPWVDSEVTAAESKAGAAWPKGGITAASGDKPLSVGVVTQKEIEVNGRKQKVDSGIEFDLTGAVRAWVSGQAPNCGVVLDNRLEGGAYDIFSSREFRPERRPYLEITLSPAIAKQPEPMKVEIATPTGDYWVEHMREIHKQLFKGKPGTLTQYGDSITVTGAFLAPYGYGKKIVVKNVTPEVQKELDVVEKYCDLSLWRKWKEAGYGNTGMMTSDWLFRNVDGWQKKMNGEVAVIMFGTNDLGGLMPPNYTENMAASCLRMMQDGTVPMLTSIPPSARGRVDYEYWLAAMSIAKGLKIPLIDFYAEVLRRQPEDWNGALKKYDEGGWKGYNVPALVSRDGTHPSNPSQYTGDWSEEALTHNGYGLRNYMTIRMYYQVITKVFQNKE